MFERLSIPEVFLYTPKRFADGRGYFSETFRQSVLDPMTGPLEWVQDNHSRSAVKGTVRGLHFQVSPFAQDKLVRCVRGSVLDVAVDLRVGSPTYGKYVSALLSEDNGAQIFVPKGFAHGFVTRVADCEVLYKQTAYYNPDFEHGIRFDDPALAIDWGVPPAAATLSDKDRKLPLLSELPIYFRHG